MTVKRNAKVFIILNFTVPILCGAVIYYLLSPDVVFVKLIDGIVGRGVHFTSVLRDNCVVQFVRFYFLDMLWGYALIFALYFIIGNNMARLKKSFIVTFVFSTSMELFQLIVPAGGTFDIFDIIFEFLAEIIAVFIIKIILLRRH